MKPQPRAHPLTAHKKARRLLREGCSLSEIARRLGVARQTVRRWLIAGEKERHNRVIHDYQRKVYKRKGPDPSIGRCKQDVVGVQGRIYQHQERIRKELANVEV